LPEVFNLIREGKTMRDWHQLKFPVVTQRSYYCGEFKRKPLGLIQFISKYFDSRAVERGISNG
jgi:hypothetical protein